MGMFDDLIPSAPTSAPSSGGSGPLIVPVEIQKDGTATAPKQPPAPIPGMFDDLIPKANGGRAIADSSDVTPSGIAAAAATGAVKGAANLVGAPALLGEAFKKPADAATSSFAQNYIDPIIEHIAGLEPGQLQKGREAAPPPPDPLKHMTGSAIIEAIKSAGVPLHEAQNQPERYAETIGEFAPTALLGPGGAVAKTANATIPAIGSEYLGSTFKNTPLETPARVIGGLAGGIATGLPMAARQGALKVVQPVANDATDAAERIGVALPQAAASDSMTIQRLGEVASKIPVAGNPLIRASENAKQQIADAADRAAASVGGSSQFSAGTAAKEGISNWVSADSAKPVNDAYSKLNNLINPQVATPLLNTRNVVADIAARRAAAHLPDGQGLGVRQVLDAATSPTGLTFAGLKDLRTTIGQRLDDSLLPSDWSKAELRQIYSGLSSDLAAAAQNAGGPAGAAAYKAANQVQKTIAGRREALAKIVGTSGDASPEQVFDRLASMAKDSSRGNIALLAKARSTIDPTDWAELSGTVVSRLGRDAAGDFSPVRFISDYGRLSDAGKAILFNKVGGGNLRQSLDDIATVSQRFKQLQKFSNPSGTAQNVAGFGIFEGLLHEPLSTLGGLIGGSILSRALAKPVTAASISKWTQAYTRASAHPIPGTIAALQLATRNLSSNLGNPAPLVDFGSSLSSSNQRR